MRISVFPMSINFIFNLFIINQNHLYLQLIQNHKISNQNILYIVLYFSFSLKGKQRYMLKSKYVFHNNQNLTHKLSILLVLILMLVKIEAHQAHPNDSQIDNIFSYIIIVGGYVFLFIGIIIYRMETQSEKIITFEQVYTKDKSSSGVVTESGHKFQDFNQEIELPKKISQEDGNDSARRKKRKRKADRLSDRRNRQSQNNIGQDGQENSQDNE